VSISDWAIALIVVLVVIVGVITAFGTVGYIIAGRSINRSFQRYIVRYAVVFLSLLGLEAIILWLAPSIHRTLQHLTAVVVGWVLGLVDVHNSVSGSAVGVQEPYIVFKIDVACLGGLLFWGLHGPSLCRTTGDYQTAPYRPWHRSAWPSRIQPLQDIHQHLHRVADWRQCPQLLLPFQHGVCVAALGRMDEDSEATASKSSASWHVVGRDAHPCCW